MSDLSTLGIKNLFFLHQLFIKFFHQTPAVEKIPYQIVRISLLQEP
jgi:hypothetical protein